MKRWFINGMSCLLAILLLVGTAGAEAVELGNHANIGVKLAMTEADSEMGISSDVSADSYGNPILSVVFSYMPVVAELEPQLMEAAYANDEEKMNAILEQYYQHSFLLAQIMPVDKAIYESMTADGQTAAELLGYETGAVAGENEGYVYLSVVLKDEDIAMEDAQEQEAALKAAARTRELIEGITFQPIEFSSSSGTAVPNAFPAFSALDLNGNTVTNDIFAGKDLTVINIWGTFCGPCINEMPELGEWSRSMPENVQIIGLVSDLYTAEDAETLETARMICEKAGVDYVNLVAEQEFMELLSGVVGVPTTIFVDGTGAIVGEPVVGAYVDGYKQFVEDYLNALP